MRDAQRYSQVRPPVPHQLPLPLQTHLPHGVGTKQAGTGSRAERIPTMG